MLLDQFGRARGVEIETRDTDPYDAEEALSVALAERCEALTMHIRGRMMLPTRAATLLRTLRAIRLDRSAVDKLDQLQADMHGGVLLERYRDCIIIEDRDGRAAYTEHGTLIAHDDTSPSIEDMRKIVDEAAS